MLSNETINVMVSLQNEQRLVYGGWYKNVAWNDL
jgi:hypothetical protein